MSKGEVHRRINTRMLIIYFLSLITVQVLGILYFLRHPSAFSGLIIGILAGTLAPILLAVILMKLIKTIYRGELT